MREMEGTAMKRQSEDLNPGLLHHTFCRTVSVWSKLTPMLTF